MTETKTKEPVDLLGISTEELENALKQKQAADKAEREKKRKDYENSKSDMVEALGATALEQFNELKDFKAHAMEKVQAFKQQMLEYGDIRKGEANKGNFEIKNDRFKIVYSSQVKKCFDERAELAEVRLKKFLETFVKKRDKDLHALVMGLLERNQKTGDLDISNIQRLYQLEDKFDNEDWREAIKLFKESYNADGTAYYVRFYVRNPESNAWELINLNFANIQ